MRALPNTTAGTTLAKHHPAADTAAVVTIAAVAGQRHVIDWIHFGYDKVSDAVETLTVAIAGTTVWQISIPVDVDVSGPHFISFPHGLYGTGLNEAVVVTLSASGNTCTGKVNVGYR